MDSILNTDALAGLRSLPAESVQCIVTSPPYWGLRDYGVAGQLGLEPLVDCQGWATGADCGECYICRMRAVMIEARRVLRKDGTCWVNMGDTYSIGTHDRHSFRRDRAEVNSLGRKPVFLKPKNIMGVPWRLAFALQADGWILRSDIIWHKPTAMPEAVRDRPTKAHEYLFLLTQSPAYLYDFEAIQEAVTSQNQWYGNGAHKKSQKVPAGWDIEPGAHGTIHRNGRGRPRQNASFSAAIDGPVERRNLRTVWTIPAAKFSEAHFATFPPALVEPCIKAGCPAGGVVLDPFFGAGTTGLVARRLGRKFVGIEINPEYCRMAQERIERETGLFGPVSILGKEEANANAV